VDIVTLYNCELNQWTGRGIRAPYSSAFLNWENIGFSKMVVPLYQTTSHPG